MRRVSEIEVVRVGHRQSVCKTTQVNAEKIDLTRYVL